MDEHVHTEPLRAGWRTRNRARQEPRCRGSVGRQPIANIVQCGLSRTNHL